jgi:hypothetical protein
MDWTTRESQFPYAKDNILFSKMPRVALRSSQCPIQWAMGATATGEKQSQHEADHSPPYKAEITNEWSYTSISPHSFMEFTCNTASSR